MFEIVKKAMSALYAEQLGEYQIYLIDEYTPEKFPAPNLWFEKRHNPEAKYIVILTSDNRSVPALGKTVCDAIEYGLSKIKVKQ